MVPKIPYFRLRSPRVLLELFLFVIIAFACYLLVDIKSNNFSTIRYPVRLSRYLHNVNNKVPVMKKVPTTVIR